jgi:3-oxoacyl-[acyl-carrier protein] reductase
MGKLDGKIALITGASRGIGRGIALDLAREGADIVVNYRRDADAASSAVAAIQELGRKAIAVQADVSEWPAVQRMAEQALAQFGRIDIVVANSGIASRVVPVWDLDVDHWHKVININLHGVFYTVRATVGEMIKRRSGNVILISSIGADQCGAMGAPYYAAKAAVNALTKSLAKECAPARVRVNCIAPGVIATDMGERMIKFHGEALLDAIPLGRPGTPEDIGKAAVYLASDDASFVTGKILRVDGGAWM